MVFRVAPRATTIVQLEILLVLVNQKRNALESTRFGLRRRTQTLNVSSAACVKYLAKPKVITKGLVLALSRAALMQYLQRRRVWRWAGIAALISPLSVHPNNMVLGTAFYQQAVSRKEMYP